MDQLRRDLLHLYWSMFLATQEVVIFYELPTQLKRLAFISR